MKKERPILFSTPMVQALLDGRKTMTRRTIKPQPVGDLKRWKHNETGAVSVAFKTEKTLNHTIECPYGKPGDVLWVRETMHQNGELGLSYIADSETIDEDIIPADYGPYGGSYSFRNIPNIHMPKWAARIWLEIVDIKVERVNRISEQDAIAEGVESHFSDLFQETRYKDYENPSDEWRDPTHSFMTLWESINGFDSWDNNVWVWVIEFKKIEKPDFVKVKETMVKWGHSKENSEKYANENYNN